MKAHGDLKATARATLSYLDRELERIGWDYKTAKFVWSFEVRIIYGSSGDNKHPEKLKPIVFYNKDNPELKFKCYMITLARQSSKYYCKNGDRDYTILFATNFGTGKYADVYKDEWIINEFGQDGIEAVDAFIEYLESLSKGADDAS